MKIWKKIEGNFVVTDSEMKDGFWIAKLSEKEAEEALSGRTGIHKVMALFESRVFSHPRTERELMKLFPMRSVQDLDREWVWKGDFLTLVVEGEDWHKIGYGKDKIALFDDEMEETSCNGNRFSDVANEVERKIFSNPRPVTVNPKWSKAEFGSCLRFENVRIRRSLDRERWFAEIDGRLINSVRSSFSLAVKYAEEFVFKYYRSEDEIKNEFPELSLIWKGDELYLGGKKVARLFNDVDSFCVEYLSRQNLSRAFVVRAKSRKEAVEIAESLHTP